MTVSLVLTLFDFIKILLSEVFKLIIVSYEVSQVLIIWITSLLEFANLCLNWSIDCLLKFWNPIIDLINRCKIAIELRYVCICKVIVALDIFRHLTNLSSQFFYLLWFIFGTLVKTRIKCNIFLTHNFELIRHICQIVVWLSHSQENLLVQSINLIYVTLTFKFCRLALFLQRFKTVPKSINLIIFTL